MQSFWQSHGTKLLGLVVALIGAMGDVQQLFIAYDSNPKHVALYSLVAALGGAIIKRGFTNSANNPPPAALLVAFLITLPLVLQVVACSTLSFQQQLAAAYGTYTTVESAADQAYVGGSLPKAQAQAARDLAKQVRPFLDAAQLASTAGDAAGAASDLVLAQKALSALQDYVNAQLPQGKK